MKLLTAAGRDASVCKVFFLREVGIAGPSISQLMLSSTRHTDQTIIQYAHVLLLYRKEAMHNQLCCADITPKNTH